MASHFPRKISIPLTRVCLLWFCPPLWFLVMLPPPPSGTWDLVLSWAFLAFPLHCLCPECLLPQSLGPGLLILFQDETTDHRSNGWPTHSVILLCFLFLHDLLHCAMIAFIYSLFVSVSPIHWTISSIWMGHLAYSLSIPGARTQNTLFG